MLLNSCTFYKGNEKLEMALEESGTNRIEFEKVIQYYTMLGDSLKLQAAIFLIENMPGHYTLEGEAIDYYKQEFDKKGPTSYLTRKVFDLSLKSKKEIQEVSVKKQDILFIKADYLIHHIDMAFNLREKCPWMQKVSFIDFLEYILPYRLENESIDYWLDSLKIVDDELQTINYEDDAKYSLLDAERYVHLQVPQINYDEALVKSVIYSNCKDEARREVFKSRALGIPAAVDFILHYPNRNGYHEWKTIVSSDVQYREMGHLLARKAGKVYRRTYSHNKVVEKMFGEYIPDFFLDSFNKDVTSYYFNVSDVELQLKGLIPNTVKHVYLCVFNDLKWQPVAITTVHKKCAHFRDMAKDIVYIPAYFQGDSLCTFSDSFVLTVDGTIKKCVSDGKSSSLRLTRKYPFNHDLHQFSREIEGTVVLASNDKEFQKADTIGYLHSSNMHYFDLPIKAREKYRYWRLVGKEFTPLNMAEVVFEDSGKLPLKGIVDESCKQLFDGNPLTSTTITARNAMLSIDFEKPASVSRIIIVPRGDGNGVYPNNLFELLCWDNDKWKSFGKYVSSDYFLDYSNVPHGALLWFRNLTTGMQERIFTWDGKNITYW